VGDATSCWPRFPLQGKPGTTAGCQAGSASEPYGDAFDCMSADDQTAVTWVLVNWAKALEAYERKLVSGAAPFDAYLAEGPDSQKISGAARRGAALFVGKAACIDCHNTPLFSDGLFHNIGVPQAGPAVPTLADCPAGSMVCDCTAGTKCLPFGAWDGTAKLNTNAFRHESIWSDGPERGTTPPTLDVNDSIKGAWRTPSLRNVALTAPYMHDGFYQTLEDVVGHYNNGPEPDTVGTPAVDIKPLLLTPTEADDLVEFLKTLTGAPLDTSLIGPGS
jgi:cytochrome c peroxidase